MTNKFKIIIFDMDGVLVRPYTSPEVLFEGADSLIRALVQSGHTVLISSFNPRAYPIFKDMLDEGVIKGIRAGSRSKWWALGDGTYSDELHRSAGMNKGLHIHDMIEDELKELQLSSDTRLELEQPQPTQPALSEDLQFQLTPTQPLKNQITQLIFVDDTTRNLIEVQEHFEMRLPHLEMKTVHVRSEIGVTMEDLFPTPTASKTAPTVDRGAEFTLISEII